MFTIVELGYNRETSKQSEKVQKSYLSIDIDKMKLLKIITLYYYILGCWHITEHDMGNRQPPPGKYGEYGCDSPWALLESAANTMRAKQGDNVEFVLWTG